MKTQIKKIAILVLSSVILASCNSGESKTPNTLNNQVFTQQYKLALQQDQQIINLNLYNSIFISPDKEYTYKVTDLTGQSIANGSFVCKNIGECLITGITAKKDSIYLISVLDKASGSFIGGTYFNIKNALTYMELSIDDISTANYISLLMQQKLQNQFEIYNLENRLFAKPMSYKKDTSLSQMIYAYYNFLIKTKNLSHDDALNNIADQYKNCEQNNICNLDNDFIKNEQVIIDAVNNANSAIEKYAQDKKDSSLYESYKWFKENIKDNFDKYKDAVSGGVDIFFPGTGGKNAGTAGKIFDVIGAIFNLNGLDDSKAAYDRVQLFNNNLSKYYTAATPNYLEIMTELGSQLLALQVRKDFLEKGTYALNIQQIVNNILSGKGIIKFINDSDKNSFGWIAEAWSMNNVSNRKTNVDYITNPGNINALAVAYKNILKTTPENNVNNIKNRQLYNQLLMSNMQDAVSSLQASMYLDTLAIMMKDKKPDFKDGLNPTQIAVATISLTGNYNTDIASLNSYYRVKLNDLKIAYQNAVLPEKEFVAEQVLQTVEIEGKCLITDTDGINYLSARCPYYYKEDNILKTKYITSRLDKPISKCLTVNDSADGDITKIADVRNIMGTLQCFIQNSKGVQILAVQPFADVNSGNSWYWNNSNYFYPNMQGHRMAFLNSPIGSFKFTYLNKNDNKYKTTNQFNLSDIKTQSDNNYLSFTALIKDNNDNQIGAFVFSEITTYGKSNPMFAVSSTHSGSTCSFPQYTSIGDNSFSCKSPLDTIYTISMHGIARYKIGLPLENYDIDWLFTGENPDGSSTKNVILPGGWKNSCGGDGLSNGYYIVAGCKDRVKQRKVTVFGNGNQLLNECSNEDGIIQCNYK